MRVTLQRPREIQAQPRCHAWQPTDTHDVEECSLCGARCQRDSRGRIVLFALADAIERKLGHPNRIIGVE